MSPSRKDDPLAPLLEGVARGDRKDFRELYERTRRFVFSRILKLISDQSEAEELLQETYVRIWKNASSFDCSRGRAITWISALARNLTINRIRSSAFRATTLEQPIEFESDIIDQGTDVELSMIKVQRDAEISKKVQSLRPQYRQVLEMSYVQGLTYAEMSETLGIPVNTLKTWIRRAIIEVRNGIEGDQDDL